MNFCTDPNNIQSALGVNDFLRIGTKMTEKPRGRPRAYDPDVALWQALETFWANGFARTSLDALAAATGMNRPSLYAAFGDKKSLYLKSFECFAGQLRAALARTAESDAPLDTTLRNFFHDAIEIYMSGPDGPRGCFIICTAPVEAAMDADIRAALKTALEEIDEGLEIPFAKAKADGYLPPDADTAALARIAASVLHSLAVRARAGETREALHALARQTVQTLC